MYHLPPFCPQNVFSVFLTVNGDDFPKEKAGLCEEDAVLSVSYNLFLCTSVSLISNSKVLKLSRIIQCLQ